MAGDETFARRVSSLGTLADPVRRALYRFVSDQPGAVSRSQAADGVDVATHTAKFHLERLVEEGLLVAEFRRLTGRTGPGAGRPAKLYRRSRREVVVSLPHRRYDLAADVLADAVERSLDGTPMSEAIGQAADRAAMVAVEETAGDTADTEDELERTAAALSPFGYEPRVEQDLVLGNCPFDRLATDHRDLVCGMNLAFVEAVTERLGCSAVRTDHDPDGARCCVRVVPKPSGGGPTHVRNAGAT
ncbi:MAG: helix-turn-helix transcriptional regulator [Nocardioides sp.]